MSKDALDSWLKVAVKITNIQDHYAVIRSAQEFGLTVNPEDPDPEYLTIPPAIRYGLTGNILASLT